MKRRIATVLLSLGVVLGYGGFVFRLCHGPRGAWVDRRAAFEKRVAGICAEAALEARDRAGGPGPSPGAR